MKRLIFALLYQDGSYVLSRNFRLQRIGDINWVLKNYGILDVSQGIDELMILNVSAGNEAREQFRNEVAILAEECFVPILVGGGVSSIAEADRLFSVGADKILVNAALTRDPQLVQGLVAKFGSQAVIAGVDVSSDPSRISEARRSLVVERGDLERRVRTAIALGVGEVCIQSVDRDGTGNGLDLGLASELDPTSVPVPIVLMGGVGRAEHFLDGLRTPGVDAVVTANLLNFVGDALVRARSSVVEAGIDVPTWSSDELRSLRDAFALQDETEAEAARSGSDM